MTTLETKYSIGEVVYRASTVVEAKKHPCPDCLGTRQWSAVSPAGSEYQFPCPRCSVLYSSNDKLSLAYSAHVASVSKLTIGSINYTTHDSWSKGPKTQYMCLETGVGSGSLYDEDSLFETEEAALVVANLKATEANQTTDWIVQKYNKSLSISDYELQSASLKHASDAKYAAQATLYGLGYLFEKIEEADDKDAILEEVESYKTYDWQNDKDGIAKLFAPAVAEVAA